MAQKRKIQVKSRKMIVRNVEVNRAVIPIRSSTSLSRKEKQDQHRHQHHYHHHHPRET